MMRKGIFSHTIKKPLQLSITLLIVIYCLSSFYVQKSDYYAPPYNKIDISSLLEKRTFSDEEYAILYAQTGIAKPIIDEIKYTNDFKSRMLEYQNYYFSNVSVKSKPMSPVTFYDVSEDENNKPTKLFELAPYKNGYIFFHKSTHTFNWRHGHVGLVVDAKHGKVLESLEPGTTSILQDAEKWTYFPTFRMMRLKDTSIKQMDEIAAYAKEHLSDIPYSIFSLKNKKNDYSTTHCSLLIWQAFYKFGIDLDSNKGIFVSPKDLASSDYLETLQVFGVNPNKKW
jgi:uncharacterized protein YycO